MWVKAHLLKSQLTFGKENKHAILLEALLFIHPNLKVQQVCKDERNILIIICLSGMQRITLKKDRNLLKQFIQLSRRKPW